MDKKRIGILTYHSSDNFGSVLQAYALQKYLNSICSCEIIDYRKDEVRDLYKIIKPYDSKYNIITNIYNILHIRQLKNRKSRYENFRINNLPLTKCVTSKAEIEMLLNEFDMLICGSDQVWNFDIIDFDKCFMLDFNDFKGKRFSYAASFGPIKKDKNKLVEYKTLFEKFDKITVREKQASESLSEISVPSECVVDPVFLLDREEWDYIANQSDINIDYDYMICYFPGGVSKKEENESRKLAKKYNCKRILLMPEWRNIFRSGKKMYNCGPCDFVKLIKNARYVYTTSFHGTAFSVIYDKNLYPIRNKDISDNRILSLIENKDAINDLIKKSKRTLNSFVH